MCNNRVSFHEKLIVRNSTLRPPKHQEKLQSWEKIFVKKLFTLTKETLKILSMLKHVLSSWGTEKSSLSINKHSW